MLVWVVILVSVGLVSGLVLGLVSVYVLVMVRLRWVLAVDCAALWCAFRCGLFISDLAVLDGLVCLLAQVRLTVCW